MCFGFTVWQGTSFSPKKRRQFLLLSNLSVQKNSPARDYSSIKANLCNCLKIWSMDTRDATVFYLNACAIGASMTFLSDINFIIF